MPNQYPAKTTPDALCEEAPKPGVWLSRPDCHGECKLLGPAAPNYPNGGNA